MRAFHSFSILALGLALSACSSDDDDAAASGGTTQTGVNANNPAGAGGVGTSGAGGSNATSAGGSEGGTANIGLSPGGAGNDSASTGTGGSAMAAAGASGAGAGGAPPVEADAGGAVSMSFFVTSVGGPDGGNFGGIDGADALCQSLATASDAALGSKTWRAYLSTTTENARERIGAGPWRNFAGRIVANDLEQLHDQAVDGSLNATWPLNDATIAVDETGAQVPLNPVLHDILTGTLADGTLAAGANCTDWTATMGTVQVGHSNRAGGGNAESWAAAHTGNAGCAPATANGQAGTVSGGGGRGSIYCFAAD